MDSSEFYKNSAVESKFENLPKILAKSGCLVMATDAFMRERNEDRLFLDLDSDTFAVVDGMGGYNYGDIAAEAVVRAIKEGIKTGLTPAQIQIEAYEIMRRCGVTDGGACYLAGTISGKKLNIWYAGDVTAILFNEKGEIKFKSVNYGLQNVPRGIKPGHPSVDTIRLMNYDRLLIASDGLWNNVIVDEVIELIKSLPIEEAVKELAILAKKGMTEQLGNGSYGNRDNLSIILYQILPVPLRKYNSKESGDSFQ